MSWFELWSAGAPEEFKVALLVAIGLALGYLLSHLVFMLTNKKSVRARVAAAYRDGRSSGHADALEDMRLKQLSESRSHTYFGATEPKRAPGPRDW